MATQTLTFVKVGEEYVAAFEISANFALHLEREEVGSLSLGISSIPDSEFAHVDNIPERARYQTVFDYTFSGDVFPKYVKVASVTYPNIAVVVSEGEITPIKIKGDIPDPGVYIQHINGEYFTTEEWTAGGYSNDLANGVLVASKECTFVMAKEDIPSTPIWGNIDSTDGILMTPNEQEAKQDYIGKHNTELISGGAASSCANYEFPNGKKGYLPAYGEWDTAYQYKSEVDATLALIGGAALNASATSSGYWSSTLRYETYAWKIRWADGVMLNSYTMGNALARAFTTL